mgnify:CR=1 FL=1
MLKQPIPLLRVSCFKAGACLLMVLFLLSFLTVKSAYPQEIKQSDVGLGINLAAVNIPEDEALSDTGGESQLSKFELYFDWAFLRLGFNNSQSNINFDAHNKSWDATLTVNVMYAAYRLSSKKPDSDMDFYAMAGLAIVDSELEITGISNTKSGNFGYLLGGGAFYYLGDFGFGPQVLVVSADGDFDGVKAATGFTQLQLGFKYGF